MDKARGYIASGVFVGNRIPQHIQNKIIRDYCTNNSLHFVLSRAEYNFMESCFCQLWAALSDDYPHIVFYSIWQLPTEALVRKKVYLDALERGVTLHFACEDLKASSIDELEDIELLVCIGIIAYKEQDISLIRQSINMLA